MWMIWDGGADEALLPHTSGELAPARASRGQDELSKTLVISVFLGRI
jgi:hypothetical protein